ncbi:MAG: ATP-binding protein [Gammaproteobacteria bacterium]|nr:ATP-binding protein [Gammaproteobacteria bacterium]
MASKIPRKPPSIIDREAEWRELAGLSRTSRPELVFVLGRRRAGKSHLLSQFTGAFKGLYYQASSRTEHEQLLNFSHAIGRTFSDPALMRGVAFPSWDALFDDLTERAAARRGLVVVIDEFPYLAGAAPGIASLIQRHWDHSWSKVPIKLILSGSHITAMQRLETGDQPLYGRRTARIQFSPFTFSQVPAFLPGSSAQDQLRAYGMFGGLPGNLALLDPEADLATNAARILLRPTGRLYDDAQHMLDAFLPSASVHYSIIEAIARGERVWSRITSRVGRDGGSLLRPAQWLQEMGIIRRVTPFTESNAVTSKRALYEIADPYLTFWHRYIAPLVSSGGTVSADSNLLWRRLIEPRLDDYMGEVFESVCREFVASGSVPRFRPVRTGRWWDAAAANQIDIVAADHDGRVLVAECKWGLVDVRDLETLRKRAALMAREMESLPSLRYVLFSGRAPVDPLLQRELEAGRVSWFGLSDLLQ